MLRFTGSSDIKNYVKDYLEARDDLKGKNVAYIIGVIYGSE